jgi:hypothetical protein
VNANQIIAAATQQCTQDGFTSFPALCVLLENQIRQLCQERDTLEGTNAKASNGCGLHKSHFGDAEVLVEYEYEPADGDGWNEPHYDAQVIPHAVFLNGVWCDAEDVASEKTRERWAEEIFQGFEDEKAYQAESAAEARREDALLERQWVTL